MSSLQQTLDQYQDLAIDGPQTLAAPLYLSDGWVRGVVPSAALDCPGGQVLVVGKPRGLVDAEYYPEGGGFRTHGDSFLFARGMEWDLGPMPASGSRGWATVTRLRVQAVVTRLGFPGAWERAGAAPLALAGMNDRNAGSGIEPAPWGLWAHGSSVRLHYRLQDGSTDYVEQAITPADTTITIDLDTGELGQGLADNTHVICGIGRTPLFPRESGSAGSENGDWPDLQFASLAVAANGVALCSLGTGRPATYVGGDSLPLMNCTCAHGGSWLEVMHKTEVTADAPPEPTTDAQVRDVKLTTTAAAAVVNVAAPFGGRGLLLERCSIEGGTRGIQTGGQFSSVYPFAMVDCTVLDQLDVGVWLYAAAGVTLDRLRADYSRRGCGEFWDSRVNVTGATILAPPDPAQDFVYAQHGGSCYYEGQVSDYEATDPDLEAFLVVYPSNLSGPTTPTEAILSACLVDGGNTQVVVKDRAANYTGAYKVVADEDVLADEPELPP